MKEVHVFINGRNDLEVDIINDNVSDKIVSFVGKSAYDYIKIFYLNELKDVIEDRDNLILCYSDSKLILEDLDKIFEKNRNALLFKPIAIAATSFVNDSNVKKAKNKKVKRVNKYSKKKIIASALVVLIMGVTSVNALSDKDKKEESEKEIKPKTETVQVVDEEKEVSIEKENKEVKEEIKEAIKEEKEVKKVKEVSNENKKEENNKEVKEEKKEQDVVSSDTIYIDYDDRSDSDKAINAHKYEDVINKYSNMYGLDPKLMLALATQERGEHSEYQDEGGATGLMQIQNKVWAGTSLKAYNFDMGDYETIVVDENMLSDLDYNVKVGCMIFSNYLNHADYNILQALQGYNMGIFCIDNKVDEYASVEGKSFDEVRSNQNDIGWMSYRDSVPFGDSNYIENVLSYSGDDCTFKFKKPNNEEVTINITSDANKKSLKV